MSIRSLSSGRFYWPRCIYIPNSAAATLPVYDGEERNSQGTGAEAPEDFPDSVAADTSEYYSGEEVKSLVPDCRGESSTSFVIFLTLLLLFVWLWW